MQKLDFLENGVQIPQSKIHNRKMAEEIPVQEIAELFERDPAEVGAGYQGWLNGRNKKRKRPQVPDIKLLAALSGMSMASVSNFLRNKQGSVSAENAERLAELVDLVGYVPSSAAQSLRGQQRHTIGIAVPLSSISPDFYLEILAGIKREADILGYSQLVFDVTTEEAREDFFYNMPFTGIVDGLIAIGLFIDDSRLRILQRQHIPVTAVHNKLDHPAVIANVITTSENALCNLIDQHLIKMHGYRRLALVTLETSNPLKMGDSERADWSRGARIEAYKEALRRNNLPLADNPIYYVANHSFAAGYEVFERIYADNHGLPTAEQIKAIVCTSDTLAAAVLTAARRKDIQIPVTGFDNLPLAELLDITTIEQRAKNVGRLAFRHLYNALVFQKRTGKFPAHVEEGVEMQAVLRCSCGCPH